MDTLEKGGCALEANMKPTRRGIILGGGWCNSETVHVLTTHMVHTHALLYMYILVCAYVYEHMHIHTYMYTCTHTCTIILVLSPSLPLIVSCLYLLKT